MHQTSFACGAASFHTRSHHCVHWLQYACIYGIQCLSKHGPLSSMSTDKIASLISTCKGTHGLRSRGADEFSTAESNNASLALENTIPKLRTRLDRLHSDLNEFEDALAVRPRHNYSAQPAAHSREGVSGGTQTGGPPTKEAAGGGYPRVVMATARKAAPKPRPRTQTIAGVKRTMPVVRHNLTSKYPFVDNRGTVEQALEGGTDPGMLKVHCVGVFCEPRH